MFYKVIIGCFEPLDQSGFLFIKHSLCPPTLFIRKRSCLIVCPNHSRIPPTLPQISKGLVTRLLYHPVIANIFLLQGKNDTTHLVDKMFVTSIIRTRIKCEEIKLSCQFFFFLTVMIFQRWKSYSFVYLSPGSFFSFNTLSILARTPI